jgi:hypothetical protein
LIGSHHHVSQLELPPHLNIDKAIGVSYIGKPIVAWLAEWMDQGQHEEKHWPLIAEKTAFDPTTGQDIESILPPLLGD